MDHPTQDAIFSPWRLVPGCFIENGILALPGRGNVSIRELVSKSILLYNLYTCIYINAFRRILIHNSRSCFFSFPQIGVKYFFWILKQKRRIGAVIFSSSVLQTIQKKSQQWLGLIQNKSLQHILQITKITKACQMISKSGPQNKIQYTPEKNKIHGT